MEWKVLLQVQEERDLTRTSNFLTRLTHELFLTDSSNNEFKLEDVTYRQYRIDSNRAPNFDLNVFEEFGLTTAEQLKGLFVFITNKNPSENIKNNLRFLLRINDVASGSEFQSLLSHFSLLNIKDNTNQFFIDSVEVPSGNDAILVVVAFTTQ